MCGIAGVFGRPDSRQVEKMLYAMRWRGPDGQGVFADHRVTMGHNRLAILDLQTGSQPMGNESGELWVAFNGEIYNYSFLRKELEAAGHTFRTRSDTEVLLHLYEDMGPGMVSRLDGMFAFALYNGKELMLARDPHGIKPLYYAHDAEGALYFASEIKVMVPFVDDVREFPGGYYFTTGGGFKPYCSLPAGPPDLDKPEEILETLEEKLRLAVAKRLMADVPLGVFLSGGLDSSLIAAITRKLVKGELHSFGVGMPGSEDLERSRQVAAYLGTIHHAFEYGPEEIAGILPRVIYLLESFDPALVRSAIPCYFVSRMARQYVKVVLTGEGADELFAGYHSLKRLQGPELHAELLAITANLHHTNLQRVDRMTMAHSLEGRVPFLDWDLTRFAFRLSPALKLRGETEKWILRRLAETYLPADIFNRRKEKFSLGTGTGQALARLADGEISDLEFRRNRRLPDGGTFGSKEELLYYRIFCRHFPAPVAAAVGRTRTISPGEFASTAG